MGLFGKKKSLASRETVKLGDGYVGLHVTRGTARGSQETVIQILDLLPVEQNLGLPTEASIHDAHEKRVTQIDRELYGGSTVEHWVNGVRVGFKGERKG
jgi:hypothetical protein